MNSLYPRNDVIRESKERKKIGTESKRPKKKKKTLYIKNFMPPLQLQREVVVDTVLG